MVFHHNHVKACSTPFNEGEIFCLVKESGEVEFLPEVVELDEVIWGFRWKMKTLTFFDVQLIRGKMLDFLCGLGTLSLTKAF